MAVEAAVAVWSGVRAASVWLFAFGADSIIEIASAGALIWCLTVELRHGRAFAETAERIAGRICGGLLLALASYVVAAAAWSLWTRLGETFSWPGLAMTGLAMPVLYFLARRKLALADRLGSLALRADVMEAVTCGWLSLVVVVGLAAQALTAAWWVDPVTSLGVVWFLEGGPRGLERRRLSVQLRNPVAALQGQASRQGTPLATLPQYRRGTSSAPCPDGSFTFYSP